MAKLVEQRRQERAQMELEVARLERMKKHMQVSHSFGFVTTYNLIRWIKPEKSPLGGKRGV